MKIPGVVHTEISEKRHMIHVDGKTRNIGGLGDTKEEATKDFVEKAEKIRRNMGEEEFAAEFGVEEQSETPMDDQKKQTAIQAKSPTEDELLNGKPKQAVEPVVVEKVTGLKADGNLTGDKGQSSNDLTGNKL